MHAPEHNPVGIENVDQGSDSGGQPPGNKINGRPRRRVDAPPLDHRPRRVERRFGGGLSRRIQQRGGIGFDLEAAAIAAPAQVFPWRNRGVPDLERIPGALYPQMQPAIDDQAAADPDLTRHDVEHVRRAPAGAMQGYRQRGQVGVAADMHPNLAKIGAGEEAGQQAADGERVRPGEVMRGERSSVGADGRGQGQPDTDRPTIRGPQPHRQQTGDEAQRRTPALRDRAAEPRRPGRAHRPNAPVRSIPWWPAPERRERWAHRDGSRRRATAGRSSEQRYRREDHRHGAKQGQGLQLAQDQPGGGAGQTQPFGQVATQRHPMRVREGQRPGQRGAGPVRGRHRHGRHGTSMPL